VGHPNPIGQADCPIARALDVIGAKWSLLILRDLMRRGPAALPALEAGLGGVAPNTLSARLKAPEGGRCDGDPAL
jgi:DNA-binding HxlR family transcriptional regulator